MRPDDGSLPGRRMAQEGLARVRQAVLAAPLPVKILLVSALVLFVVLSFSLGARVWDVVVLVVLGYGPYALWRGRTSVAASVLVGIWGVVAILAVAEIYYGVEKSGRRDENQRRIERELDLFDIYPVTTQTARIYASIRVQAERPVAPKGRVARLTYSSRPPRSRTMRC